MNNICMKCECEKNCPGNNGELVTICNAFIRKGDGWRPSLQYQSQYAYACGYWN